MMKQSVKLKMKKNLGVEKVILRSVFLGLRDSKLIGKRSGKVGGGYLCTISLKR
ncbi:Whole genome shotgun sequence [Vibrio parahaemolyticus]